MDAALPTTLTEPSTAHHRILPAYHTLCTPCTSKLRFTRLFEYCLSNGGSATVEPPWHDAAWSAMTVWMDLVSSSVVPSLLLSQAVLRAPVAWTQGQRWRWPRYETLICASSCFEAARHVCLEFLFRGGVVIKYQPTSLWQFTHLRQPLFDT